MMIKIKDARRGILFLVMLLALNIQGSAATEKKMLPISNQLGENYIEPRIFATHAVASEFPFEGRSLFSVTANGRSVGLYNDRSYWGGLVHFGSFEFSNGREITLKIIYQKEIKSFEILPRTLKLKSVKRIAGNAVQVKLSKADQNMTLIVNGNPKTDVLHLFCNSIDKAAPEVGDIEGYKKLESKKLYYFGPGYYSLKNIIGSAQLNVENGWRVYVAAGAVIYGSINMSGVEAGTKVDGRGMVYNDVNNPAVMMGVSNCNGGEVEGVLFHGHRAQCWQVVINKSQNVDFNNVKILSTRYASTDGLDVINCQNCTFRNMFIRANDDAVAIKGLQAGMPAFCLPNENLLFEGLQLWNDCNCAFGMGAETHAAMYKNICLKNSCVLFSYDDPNHHEQMEERAALTICCLHGTYFRNLKYENVEVDHCERLVAMGFQPSFWFGTLQGDQTTPGGIEDVTMKNVYTYNNSGSKIANEISLYGWHRKDSPDKYVDGVTFDHLRVGGKKISSAKASIFKVDPQVRHLKFK